MSIAPIKKCNRWTNDQNNINIFTNLTEPLRFTAHNIKTNADQDIFWGRGHV